MITTDTTIWKLQAYLAVNPRRPEWCDIGFHVVEGYKKYRWWDKQKYLHDPRLTKYPDGWSFVSEEAAKEVLRELNALDQRHYLRVVRSRVQTELEVIEGYAIDDGTVVRNPLGVYPAWFGERVPNCQDKMPRYRVRVPC